MATDKYVTLSSNASNYFFTNKCNNFKVKLSEALDLKDGNWKVALTKICYPRSWINIQDKEATVTIVHNNHQEDAIAKQDEKLGEFIKNMHKSYRVKPHPDVIKTIKNYIETKYTPNEFREEKWMFTVVKLESGYYHDVGEIAENIVKNFKLINPNYPFDYVYERSSKKVNFYGADGMVFRNADMFVKALGMEIHNHSKPHHLCWVSLTGTGKLGVLDNIYVYSSIVEFNNVGDTVAPLISVIPVHGKHGDFVTYEPQRPEYKPITQNYISEIELQLNASNGELINFESGVVTVTLHFKSTGIVI